MPAELKAMYQAAAGVALEIAKELMLSKKQPGIVRLRAAEMITDRGYGKPVQPQDINIITVPDEELLQQAREIVAKLGGAESVAGPSEQTHDVEADGLSEGKDGS